MGDRKAPTPIPPGSVKPSPPPAPPAKRRTFEHGRIVYCQGLYACRVVRDDGLSISYVPIEGYGPESNKGKTFSAAKNLFSDTRSKGHTLSAYNDAD